MSKPQIIQPESILKLVGDKWASGYALQTTTTVGGLFKTATNFDPFEMMHYMRPSLASTQYGAGTITTTPQVCTVVNESGTPFVYVHTASKLYKVNALSGSTTDITTSSGITTGSIRGALVWRGKYIYFTDSTAIGLTIGTSTNTTLQGSLNTANHVPCIGTDGNLYFTNGNTIGKLTSATGTSGNSANVFQLEGGGTYTAGSTMTFRDLLNDGRYLVMIADRNPGSAAGTFRCLIGYWNLSITQANFEQAYDESVFEDNTLYGMEYHDGGVYVFGAQNLWVCNIATTPKLVFSFVGNSTYTSPPSSPFLITKFKGVILWGNPASGAVYGYGNPIPNGKKILFQPYTAAGGNCTALCNSNSLLFTGTDTPAFYVHNTGSTRNTATIITSNNVLNQPHSYRYTKVILRDVLSSGQSVSVKLLGTNDTAVISDTSTVAYDANNPIQTLTFLPTSSGVGTDTSVFTEISSLTVYAYGGATVQSVEVFGIPLNPQINNP